MFEMAFHVCTIKHWYCYTVQKNQTLICNIHSSEARLLQTWNEIKWSEMSRWWEIFYTCVQVIHQCFLIGSGFMSKCFKVCFFFNYKHYMLNVYTKVNYFLFFLSVYSPSAFTGSVVFHLPWTVISCSYLSNRCSKKFNVLFISIESLFTN